MTDELNNTLSFITKNQKACLIEPIPENLVFLDPGGNKYVNHMVVVDKLNEVFNHAWSWTIVDKGIEESKSFTNKKGEVSQESHYAWVIGELRYPIFNSVNKELSWAVKQAFGGKVVLGNGKVQSQAFKAASSDALKKAASLLGIAPNVYMRDDVYESLDESDSDSWTPSKMNVYQKETAQVKDIKETLGVEKFNQVIKQFCDKTNNYTQYGLITPSNIVGFLNYYSSIKQNQNPPSPQPAKSSQEEKKKGFALL